MLHLNDVTKRFGPQILFERASLHVTPEDRIGLVGPNGSGKTSLFRLIVGENEPDEGTIRRRKLLRVGYLQQEVEPGREGSVLSTVTDNVRDMGAMRHERDELLRALHELGTGGADPETAQALARRLAEIEDRFAHAGGYIDGKAREVLMGLGFTEADMTRPLRTFSGGWQVRAELARLLLEEPDILLLDEPTNHLDLESMQWFENYLTGFRGAFVLVSHDREFLNRTVSRIVEVRPDGLRCFTGDYDRYRKVAAEDRATHEKRYRDQQARIREIQDFIDRNRARKDRARQVQSRFQMLEQMEKVPPPVAENGTIHFRFPQPPRTGDVVMRLEEVTKQFGDHVVYRNLDLMLRRGDRIAIVGLNGAGKSTLLKIMAGRLAFEAGARVVGANVRLDYYAQHQLEALNVDNTVLREMATVADVATAPTIRGLLGAFQFSGDEVDKRVIVLSGGEKARLALAKMLVHPANLLLLDEPTNHLDIASREVLERALSSFEGTICFTSHDRRFIRAIATGVLEVDRTAIHYYPGDYALYEWRKKKTEAEAPAPVAKSVAADEEPRARDIDRDRKRREAERRERASRTLKPLRDEAEKLERTITMGEEKLAALAEKLSFPATYADPEAAQKTLAEHERVQQRVADLYKRWETVQHEIGQAEALLAAEDA